MKKTAVILLLLICAQTLQAQGVKMRITPKTGASYTYEVDSIAMMNFLKAPSPKYDKMDVWGIPVDPPPAYFYTASVDSMIFKQDPAKGNKMGMLILPTRGFGEIIPLQRRHGEWSAIDSITFASYETDTNIHLFREEHWDCKTDRYEYYGPYQCAVWSSNHIICSSPYRLIEIDSVYRTIKDRTSCPPTAGGHTFAVNATGTELLTVSSRFPGISVGDLYEYNTQTWTKELLFATQDNGVSSAIYSDTDKVIYYTYGDIIKRTDTSQRAGYYLFNRTTGERTLLLHFISEIGTDEMVNGFDVRPDGKKLLIPAGRKDKFPLIIEYDLATHIFDTLQVPFTFSSGMWGGTWGLWLRYSHDGTKILYSNYPMLSFGGDGPVASSTSEIGVFDRATLSKQILHSQLNDERQWIGLCPGWSPDDKNIVFCAEDFDWFNGGFLSHRVCILKTPK